MSNTIPPLLCSTPPPIDFGDEHDDDFGAFESAETEFGQFDGPSLPSTPKYFDKKHNNPVDLPVPDIAPFPTQNETKTTKEIPVENKTEKIKPFPIESQVTIEDLIESENQPNNIKYSELEADSPENFQISYIKDSIQLARDEPPPIDIGYSSESHSQKNSRGESPQSLEFSPENLSDDDDDSIEEFQVNETKYDDNTSLPSLKFDAIDLTKSETPVIDDKLILNTVSEVLTIVDEKSTISAFEPEKLAEEENNWTETIRPDVNEIEETSIIETVVASEEHSKVELSGATQSDNDLEVKDDAICDEEPISKAPDPNSPNINFSGIDEKIIESPAELEVANDDDFGCDFQEFEGFSDTQTINNDPPFTIETTNAFESSEPGEIMFEADFSQIQVPIPENSNVNSEVDCNRTQPNDIEDDFEDFQDFTTVKPEENKIDNDDDDDDFGDFNDFQDTAGSSDLPAATTPSIINVTQIDEKLKTVLEMMFPNEEDRTSSVATNDKNSLNEYNSNLTSNLRELDSAKALEYQWPNSSMKHSLVKALGIDSRNILYGEKWNSSMPRFAANLGFNPLEPLKPMKLTSSASLASSQQQMNLSGKLPISSSNCTTTDVPAVKFDWNSSGLVNPLDGVKEILHEGKAEKIYPSKSNDSDESSEPSSADKSPTVVATVIETPKFITPLPDINNDLKETINQNAEIIVPSNIENYAHHKIEFENNHLRSSSSLSSSSSSCTTFVGPLKETHIYTPSKSENSVSRSVKVGEKFPIDFDYEMAAVGIVINEQVVKKEYHDIVYNPQAQMGIAPQLLEPSIVSDPENIAIVDPNKNFRHRATASSLSPQTLNIIENSAAIPDAKPADINDDFSDFQQNLTAVEPASATTSTDLPPTDKYSSLQSTEIQSKCDKKPIEEIATKSSSFDDEFSDFQSVPAPVVQSKPIKDLKPKSRTETPTFSDEMILSPAILLPQAIKVENIEPQINWPGDPGIHPDELARLEKLFPQAKQIVQSNVTNSSINKSNSIATTKDDDDWSDFISVPATNINNTTTNQMLQAPTPTTKLSTISKTYDDDDWSEFVSSTPAAPATTVNKSPWSVAQMPPPQFNSWNQPNFFSTLPSSNQVTSQQGLYAATSQPISTTIVPTPTKPAYQINNNQSFSNGYLNPVAGQHEMKVLSQHQLQYQQQQQQHGQHQQQQRNQNVLKSQLNMSPSISLIPDLGFAAPKPFINVPRTNFSKK